MTHHIKPRLKSPSVTSDTDMECIWFKKCFNLDFVKMMSKYFSMAPLNEMYNKPLKCFEAPFLHFEHKTESRVLQTYDINKVWHFGTWLLVV